MKLFQHPVNKFFRRVGIIKVHYTLHQSKIKVKNVITICITIRSKKYVYLYIIRIKFLFSCYILSP